MPNLNSCYEVASWLNAGSSNPASDTEFAEVFALLDLMRKGESIPQIYDTESVIASMDVDGFCKYLHSVLTEIQNSKLNN